MSAAEVIAAGKTIYGPLLLSILIPVLVTLVLGKVFCSWICPANLLLEVTGKLRKLLRLAELPPAEVRFSRGNKYVLLGVGLAVAAIVGLPMFALIYPPAALSRLAHAWIFGTSMVGGLRTPPWMYFSSIAVVLVVSFGLFEGIERRFGWRFVTRLTPTTALHDAITITSFATPMPCCRSRCSITWPTTSSTC